MTTPNRVIGSQLKSTRTVEPNTLSKGSEKAAASWRALMELSAADAACRSPNAESISLLAKACREWIASEGKKSMDAILHLAATRGRDPVFKQLLISERNSVYVHAMQLLIQLGCTLDEAAYAVAEREMKKKHGSKTWPLPPLAEKSARLLYIRMGGKKSYPIEPGLQGHQRTAFLSTFPKVSLPEQLLVNQNI